MIGTKHIANIFKRLRGHSPRRPQLINPVRDWIIALVIAITVFTVGGWWSASTYLSFRNLSPDTEHRESDSVVYRESMVEAALARLDERASAYATLVEEYVSNDPPPGDPEPVVPTATSSSQTATSTNEEAGPTSPASTSTPSSAPGEGTTSTPDTEPGSSPELNPEPQF
mgnify:CR=1